VDAWLNTPSPSCEASATSGMKAAHDGGPSVVAGYRRALGWRLNPVGVTLTHECRQRLVELADRYGVPLIEDAPYGQLRYEGEHLPPLAVLDGHLGAKGCPIAATSYI
jgi:hypothetical protein